MAKEKEKKKKHVGGEDAKYGSLAKLDMAGVLSAIRKDHGKFAIIKMGESYCAQGLEVYSTGSLKVDKALGIGGLPKGRIVEFLGKQAGGKTTLALSVIADVQKQGGSAAFIDAEHALDSSLAISAGVSIEDLYLVQPDYGEQALEIAHMLTASAKFDIIVIDSVAALIPKAELEGDMEDSQMGLQARMMGKFLRKITSTASKSHTLVIFINQIREKIGVMFGSNETTPGGRALPFFASVRIDIRKIGQIKQDGEVVGNSVKVNIIKNKLAPPCKIIETDLYFGKGFSKESELLDTAVKMDIIDQSGSWFSYNEDRLGQGKTTVIKLLQENTKLFDEIYTQVISDEDPIEKEINDK